MSTRSLSELIDEAIQQEEYHRELLLFWKARRAELEPRAVPNAIDEAENIARGAWDESR